MFDISRKAYERNGIETVADNDGILRLNEKHVQEGLNHKNLLEIKIKYHSNHRKHRHVLADEPKKKPNIIFTDKKLAIRVIMDCKTTTYKFRAKLGFKQNDAILTKEKSVLKN